MAKAYRAYYKQVPLEERRLHHGPHWSLVYLMGKDGRFVSPLQSQRGRPTRPRRNCANIFELTSSPAVARRAEVVYKRAEANAPHHRQKIDGASTILDDACGRRSSACCVTGLAAALGARRALLAAAAGGSGSRSGAGCGRSAAGQCAELLGPAPAPGAAGSPRFKVIRFLTETDYPPFNFAGPDGNPQGFNVDLARMMCEELKAGCTVQMRRFETLIASLVENRGDAVVASIAPTPEARAKIDFTDPYYRMPARFVARRDSPIEDVAPEKLEGRKVAVVAGTSHEAYFRALFPEAELRAYPSSDLARLALRRSDVDLLFGDAISLAFWLNGTSSENCCAFRGGPYLEAAISARASASACARDDAMRLALNWALFRLWEQGRFTDLWLRYFPISPF